MYIKIYNDSKLQIMYYVFLRFALNSIFYLYLTHAVLITCDFSLAFTFVVLGIFGCVKTLGSKC